MLNQMFSYKFDKRGPKIGKCAHGIILKIILSTN